MCKNILMCGALPPTLYCILEYWNTMEYWNIRILGKWNIGILVTMELRYIGILVYGNIGVWYIGMVYWYIGILETVPHARLGLADMYVCLLA